MQKFFRAAVLSILACLTIPAFATTPLGYVNFYDAYLQDSTGTLVVNATLCVAPVNNGGSPLSYRVNGRGQAIDRPVCTLVTLGVFSLQLADTWLTSPQNVCFSATATDNVSGKSLLGPGYNCLQPSGQSASPSVTGSQAWCSAAGTLGGQCNFDSYPPNLAALVVTQTGPTGPTGATGPAGSPANISPGTVYQVPGYTATNTVGPSNITTDSTGNNMAVPGNVTTKQDNFVFHTKYFTIGNGSTDDTAAMASLLTTAAGQQIVVDWDGVSGHCVLISSTLTIATKGQLLTGTNHYNLATPHGGLCTNTPNINMLQIGNGTSGIANNAGIRDLAFTYTGPAASGGAVTVSPYGGVASGPTITSGGSNYSASPGVGILGCQGQHFIWTFSSGALSTATPASGDVGAGTLAASNYTGSCLPYSPNAWTASLAMAAGYSYLDTNNNVQLVTVAGTAAGSAPTWSTTRPIIQGVVGVVGGTATDGTATVTNMGPPAVWVASTATLKQHSIIVPVSGTNYIFTETNGGGATGSGSAPAFSATLHSTASDNGMTWTNEGVFGSTSMFGGSTGDPTNTASTGYAINVIGSSDSDNFDNIYVYGMGGALRATVNFSQALSHNLILGRGSDGNGIALNVPSGSPNNDDKFYGYSFQTVGQFIYFNAGAGGVGSVFAGGDNQGGWEQTGEIPSGGNSEFVTGSVDFSGGDSESIGVPLVTCTNCKMSAHNLIQGTNYPGFYPMILNSGYVNVDAVTVSRSSPDFGVPLIYNSISAGTASRTGNAPGAGIISGATDYGLSQELSSQGYTFAMPRGGWFGSGGTPAPNCYNAGGDPMWEVNGTQWRYTVFGQTTPGTCVGLDLFDIGLNGPTGNAQRTTSTVNQLGYKMSHSAVDTSATFIWALACISASLSSYCQNLDLYNASTLPGAMLQDWRGSSIYAALYSNGFTVNVPITLGTKCDNTSSPATCGAAAAGRVQVAAAGTSLVIDTTAVLANSTFQFAYNTAQSGCTSAPANIASLLPPYVSAISAGTSFTITLPVAPTTNPACIDFTIF